VLEYCRTNLETVTAVCFAINHVQNFLVDLSAQLVAHGPVVARTGTLFVNVEIFGVVDVLVWARSNGIYDSWLEVEKDGTRDIASIVGLVKEDILAITALTRKVF
jgi:hypothetical protein